MSSTVKNLIVNGNFVSQNLHHWEADTITSPEFKQEKNGSFSLKLEPTKYFHQNVDVSALKKPFHLEWKFSAGLYEKAQLGAWLAILVVGWKGTEMTLDVSLATELNDQLQKFTHSGTQEFPGDLDSLAFQVVSANKVTEDGSSVTPINVTDFELYLV